MTNLPNGKPILCIDFDGVIHSYTSGWKGATCIPDHPVKGAFEFLEESMEHFEINIYSSRSRYFLGKRAIKKWLRINLYHYFLNKNPMFIEPCPFSEDESQADILAKLFINELKFPTRKPAAFLQIDDRAITFNGKWPSIEEIKSFKPWYKK